MCADFLDGNVVNMDGMSDWEPTNWNRSNVIVICKYIL